MVRSGSEEVNRIYQVHSLVSLVDRIGYMFKVLVMPLVISKCPLPLTLNPQIGSRMLLDSSWPFWLLQLPCSELRDLKQRIRQELDSELGLSI